MRPCRVRCGRRTERWTDRVDLAFFLLGALLTTVCVALVVVSSIAMCNEELLVVVNLLAFVVIGLGGFAGAIELEHWLRSQFASNPFERAAFENRTGGRYAWYYWTSLVTSVVVPQLFWIRRFRTTAWIALVVSLVLLWEPIFELFARLIG